MDCQLRLSVGQHELIWKRKSAIEARFKVQIDSPFSRGYTPFNWVYKGFNQNDILIIAAKGEVPNVEAFEKYAAETVTNPEIIEIFSYHKDLRPIFEDIMWIEILEEIYGVYITTKTGCELNISGTESSVSSAVSAMEELILKYKECQDTLTISNETSLVPKLVYVLGVCRNVNILPGTFNRIPNAVITLLLSLLEKLYKENFPVYDDSLSLDDSVVVLDAPEKEAESSVIILDSDSDDSNVKHCCGNGSENVSKRKKKQPIPNKTGPKLKKLRKKKKCKPEGGSSQNTVSHQNGNLQLQQVGTSIDVHKLPVIENPNFIPLNFGKNAQQKCQLSKLIDSTTEVSAEQVNQPVAEEVQPAEVPKPPKQLRPVVIDGCNVAFYSTKGRREDFSWKRIEKSIKYFQDRGHTNIKVFIPQHRRALCYSAAGNQNFVEMLETEQLLVFTPSRKVDGALITCYDDRFIVDLAARNGGVILSNDNYRDLMGENVNWAETIKKRLLMYVFAGDELMIPNDPLGARGPNLDDFLAFPEGSSDGQN